MVGTTRHPRAPRRSTPESPDDRDARPPRARPEPVDRQHHPPDARFGHARPVHRGARRTGLTSNPTIYDKAIGGSDATTTRCGARSRRALARGDVLRRRAQRPDPRRRPVPRGPRDGRRRRVRVARGVPAHRLRQRHDPPRRSGSTRGRPREPVHQDPRHAGGPAGDRGLDLRGRPDQRHAAVLAKQYLAAPRPTPAASSGDRGRPRPAGHVGRVAVHQPLGRRVAEASRPTSTQARARGRRRPYAAYREFFAPRAGRRSSRGRSPQRLLFASTGTKDPTASKTLYIEGLAAPDTVNTMPEDTLLALAEADVPDAAAHRGTQAWATLGRFEEAGISIDGLGLELQQKGADAFVKSWESLLARVAEKSQAVGAALAAARRHAATSSAAPPRLPSPRGIAMSNAKARRRARAAIVEFGLRMQDERLRTGRRATCPCACRATRTRSSARPTSHDSSSSRMPIVRLDGTVVEGGADLGAALHTLLYQRRPEIGAVVHTHSPAAMAMAGARLDAARVPHRARDGGRRRRSPARRTRASGEFGRGRARSRVAARASSVTTGCSPSADAASGVPGRDGPRVPRMRTARPAVGGVADLPPQEVHWVAGRGAPSGPTRRSPAADAAPTCAARPHDPAEAPR